jgi:hypothetical protein
VGHLTRSDQKLIGEIDEPGVLHCRARVEFGIAGDVMAP